MGDNSPCRKKTLAPVKRPSRSFLNIEIGGCGGATTTAATTTTLSIVNSQLPTLNSQLLTLRSQHSQLRAPELPSLQAAELEMELVGY